MHDTIRELKEAGHTVLNLEGTEMMSYKAKSMCGWLLQEMLANGQLSDFLQDQSPSINEQEYAMMVAHLHNNVSSAQVVFYGTQCFGWVLLGVVILSVGIGVFRYVFMGLCVVNLICLGWNMTYLCRLSPPKIPDAACLYIVLVHLGICPQLRVYTNNRDLFLHPEYDFMIRHNILLPCEPDDANFRVLCVDDVSWDMFFEEPEDVKSPKRDDSSSQIVLWSDYKFDSLSESTKAKVNRYIVGKGPPTLEILSCWALAWALGCGLDDLTPGSGSFEFWRDELKQLREIPNPMKRWWTQFTDRWHWRAASRRNFARRMEILPGLTRRTSEWVTPCRCYTLTTLNAPPSRTHRVQSMSRVPSVSRVPSRPPREALDLLPESSELSPIASYGATDVTSLP